MKQYFEHFGIALKYMFYFITACTGHLYLMSFGNRYSNIAELYLFVGFLLTFLPFIQSLIMTVHNFLSNG